MNFQEIKKDSGVLKVQVLFRVVDGARDAHKNSILRRPIAKWVTFTKQMNADYDHNVQF